MMREIYGWYLRYEPGAIPDLWWGEVVSFLLGAFLLGIFLGAIFGGWITYLRMDGRLRLTRTKTPAEWAEANLNYKNRTWTQASQWWPQ